MFMANEEWHKRFAVECNNRAWDLAEKEGRTPDEDSQMLCAAYASSWHWSKIGQPVNAMRADALLTNSS